MFSARTIIWLESAGANKFYTSVYELETERYLGPGCHFPMGYFNALASYSYVRWYCLDDYRNDNRYTNFFSNKKIKPEFDVFGE